MSAATTSDKKGDPRLGSIVKPYTPIALADAIGAGKAAVVLVGFPFDEGVRRNGGRVGARDGPEQLRAAMTKMGCVDNREYGANLNNIAVFDAGDVAGETLEEAHEALTKLVGAIISKRGIPFVVGGGNDQSYPNARGLINNNDGEKVIVINVDAHLDVRPLLEGNQVHSGSPFYQLLTADHGDVDVKLVEFAAQGSQCSGEHVDFVNENGGEVVWLSDVVGNEYGGAVGSFMQHAEDADASVFLSFDVDSISSADMPGVSCPANIGLSAQEAVGICKAAGHLPQVKLVDMSEFNPQQDSSPRSARLCVLMFYFFLLGVALRE